MDSDDLPHIPRHRILRVLGEGGMGVVYEAEQLEPIRRRVALKLLKVGMDTKAFLARFEAERQALAMMDHIAIARIYEAGATPDGRPYYTLEYVPGLAINDFCDLHNLDAAARAALIAGVADGIAHAHDRGVIHRDLKPSNVLVVMDGGRPAPKIIDFGIAKAMHGRLADRTYATEIASPIGTPAYMSPEQWEAGLLQVDGRTDVYSLGVMLYELLVGRLPLDDPNSLARAGSAASVVLRERTLPTPSTRLASMGGESTAVAKLRGTDARSLAKLLRGDLDWITMRALEADRERRYGSARELSDDLRRYLRSEPVLARAPGMAYRLGRFIRRHRSATITAAVAIVAVIASIIGTAMATSDRDVAVYRETLRNDLFNLTVAEENFFSKHNHYTGHLDSLEYAPSPGVTVSFFEAKPGSWTATARHRDAPRLTCVVTVGGQLPMGGEGEAVCAETSVPAPR